MKSRPKAGSSNVRPSTTPPPRRPKPKPAPPSPVPAPASRSDLKVTAAKGRPMLVWVGKRPLSHVTAFPAQHVES